MNDSLFAVWKPVGMTSNDVLNIIRRSQKTKKVGHAGTLDPLAEGILVVGVGRDATRTLHTALAKEKEYEATVRFGMTSTTDDEEGEKTKRTVRDIPSETAIRDALKRFVGTIQQVPPQFSATKKAGQRAYRAARRGERVVLGPGTVEVKDIALLRYAWPDLELRIVTGPGVYIRSLARDLGELLGVGGYLTRLVRTRVGEWRREHARDILSL